MKPVKRAPASPGPVADLFDRLDELHAQAGRLSMRRISILAGHGNVSHSTVHNVFSVSRVPQWIFLEHIVTALGGGARIDEFRELWNAAWEAQNNPVVPARGLPAPARAGGPGRASRPRMPRPAAAPADGSGRRESLPGESRPVLSSEIPPRNPNFAGRVDHLEAIAANLAQDAPAPQVISGMGGVGKTELATEYVHRHTDDYGIIWWIRAEHHDRVRDALVGLARRLEIRQASSDGDRDETINAVLEKLVAEPEPSWLLVYDNATQPLELQRYLPKGSRPGGHVLITSRQLNWPAADSIALEPFTAPEAVTFLRHRVPGLRKPKAQGQRSTDEDERRAGDAARLAEGLGYLPIAIDHAAAYLTETRANVETYLSEFQRNAHSLYEEDEYSHAHVSGTWALSVELLTSDARHLFNLCAFFSPEPVAAELLQQQLPEIRGLPGVAELLSAPRRFRAAAGQLHRLSLAKFDGAHNLIQVHRVVQAVTQGRLRAESMELFSAYRAAVDTLLAQSNPRDPDRGDSDTVYNLSLQHLESDRRFLNTSNPALRDLIIDQVRRLHLRGAHVEAMRFGQDALQVWEERHGADDLKRLAMAVEVSVAMYMGGRIADADELIDEARPWLRRYSASDEGFKVFLAGESIYGALLRARNNFRQALELDLAILPKFEKTFGATHERTLNIINNVALDHRQLGHFDKALEADQRTFEGRRDTLGGSAPLTLYSQHALARDLRGLGRYEDSLEIARRVENAFEAANGRENPHWLKASQGFATALRKAGWEAWQESERVLQRYLRYLGADHIFTVAAAINLTSDRRAAGDLERARELAEDTYDRCQRLLSPGDMLCAAQLNLASALRMTGEPGDAELALMHDEQARRELFRIYSDRHPFTLAASINYSSDLAACGRPYEAVQVGAETLRKCRAFLGENHPDTLMAAANLSVDQAAAGNDDEARWLRADVRQRYEETLTMEHPDARGAEQQNRLTAEIEPLV